MAMVAMVFDVGCFVVVDDGHGRSMVFDGNGHSLWCLVLVVLLLMMAMVARYGV